MGGEDLFVGVLMLAQVGVLIPMFSIGVALSYHLVRLPNHAPEYVWFLAGQNDPDNPKYLLGRFLVGDRYSRQPHPNHAVAGAINLLLLVICNLLPLAIVVSGNREDATERLLFQVAFFVCEGFWFWWFSRFVSANRRSD